jgi:hypothetical protein
MEAETGNGVSMKVCLLVRRDSGYAIRVGF